MNVNTQRLNEYLDRLQGPPSFYRDRGLVLSRPETRLCLQCGAPYTISIPYVLCNPVVRDLCDDCLLSSSSSSSSSKKLSGSDPDQIRGVKRKGVRP